MKKTISATVDTKLIEWINSEIKNNLYRNKSHLIEIALINYKKSNKITNQKI